MHGTAILAILAAAGAPPVYLEDRFEVPAGFRLYRAAGPDLTGGSYDIAIDAEGRVLVGDGTQLRRLADKDGDGVFDGFEVIATGLGPRGPQGLLVYGDRLYAVGGDGIQLYEGYRADGRPKHSGRIGQPFGTGGDHDAHQVARGHDGWLYFIAGDGSGTRDRRHITEETSPCLFERSCTLFRISPDGKRWEAIGSGGRNSPNFGINYLGEFFSFDSDMEWHVDLPWYRPVRLHHWIWGGDQGWQDVGAYPPYYIDTLPGILDIGRGSPDWGQFYEHDAFPAKYRDSYLACDYLSKSATTGGYETVGRLFAFFLERDGAGWKASHEVLARPRPGARDESGKPIQFALVDLEVAPDGSLLLSDHNQGIWRMIYDPERKLTGSGAPPLAPKPAPLPAGRKERLEALLSLPQPQSEWSRARAEEIRKALGQDCDMLLGEAALDPAQDLRSRRLRALRYLSPGFADMPQRLLELLARDKTAELRGQAAWLLGLRGGIVAGSLLLELLEDLDPFVRRRAAEGLCKVSLKEAVPRLIDRLDDPVRLVRYAAMIALAHHPTASWLERAITQPSAQARMRGLVAAHLRRDPPPAEAVRRAVYGLLARRSPGDSREDRLDLLRVLGIFQRQIREAKETEEPARKLLLSSFPDPDRDIRREAARLLGEYRVPEAFGKLLQGLEEEREPVEQFHLAQALARIPSGWSEAEEDRAVSWFLSVQKGWFTQFAGKGLEFPQFWGTALSEFGGRHREALVRRLSDIELSSQLGGVVIDLLAKEKDPRTLIALYRAHEDRAARRRILEALGNATDPAAAALLRDEYRRYREPDMRLAALRGLARSAPAPENAAVLIEGLGAEDGDTARACARALEGYRLELDEALAAALLGRMERRGELLRPLEKLLTKASGKERPGFRPDDNRRERPDAAAREETLTFWRGWYAERFGRAYQAPPEGGPPERTDEELQRFLLGDLVKGGDAARGRKVYEATRCASCHGGLGAENARLFGPDLAGVTRRLNRQEVADAIAYPSKQVADRFKAKVVIQKGGPPLTGFITEETEDEVVLADQDSVHRIPRKKVQAIGPQEASLMPERLLARATDQEIRDLWAFLEELGSRPEPAKPPAAAPK